jgi:hypothetical protein
MGGGLTGGRAEADRVELWAGARAIFVPMDELAEAGAAAGALAVTIDGTPAEAAFVRVFVGGGGDSGELVGGDGARGMVTAVRWGRWWSRGGDGAGGGEIERWGVEDVRSMTAGGVGGVAAAGVAGGRGGARRVGSGFLRVDVSGVVNDPTRLGESRVRVGVGGVGDRAVSLRRIDSELITQGRAVVAEVLGRRLAAGVDTSAALNLCGGLASLPMDRWRAELVLGALGAPVPALVPAAGSDPRAEQMLTELSEQVAVRWLAAIGRLDRADRDVARAMVEQLFRIVRTETHAIPVWNAQDPSEHRVCAELLDPERGRDGLVRVAREYLDSQRGSVMWVIDDAASEIAEEPKQFRSRVGMVNLGAAPALSRVRLGAGEEVVESIGGLAGIELLTPSPKLPGASKAPDSVMAMRVGVELSSAVVVHAAVPVRPPGLDIGPLLLDWTGESWMTGRMQQPSSRVNATAAGTDASASVASDAWTATARVYFAEAGDEAGGGVGDGAWMVYLDCRQAAGAIQVEDRVTLSFGTRGESVAAVSVWADGRASDARGAPVGGVRVVAREADAKRSAGWSAWVPVPRGAISPDGVTKIGVQRVDPRGVRSAWPRPMMPWQIEPGRVGLDLGHWLGLPE